MLIKIFIVIVAALLGWLVFIQVPQLLDQTRYSYVKEETNTWKIDNQTGIGCVGVVHATEGANPGDILSTINFGDCLTK